MNLLVRKLFYALPVNLRYTARKMLYYPLDLFRDKTEMVPPKGMIFTGRGDYKQGGKSTFEHFKKYGNISPESSILDIGSGIGRMAVPFTTFLNKNGEYQGFDIVKQGVDWCTNNITARYPNFKFQLISLRNDLYNLDTNEKASKLTFPYPDNHFDFIFLTSVFTHMLPEDIEHYIKEIKRVLKPGKVCYSTFFILDTKSEDSMFKYGSKSFNHNFGNYSLMDKKVKEANVAYQKDYIFDFLNSQELEITDFFRGYWSGLTPDSINEHQDVIIFKKK